MSKFTAEDLRDIAYRGSYDDLERELALQLLASMEQEPVLYAAEEALAYAKTGELHIKCLSQPMGDAVIPLYAAPHLPQSAVMDENGLLPCPFCGGNPEEDAGGCSEYDGHEHQDYSINCKSCGAEVYCAVGSFEKADVPCSCHHNARAVCVGKWNSRAAMLHGAEQEATAYKLPFERWLSQQTGTIDVECGCVMTEVFFHWLRVAYEAGNSPVTPDGWQLVPKEPTVAMNKAGWAAINEHDEINPTYRAMLAAAPQQDVRLALEIGMSRYAGAMQKFVDSGD